MKRTPDGCLDHVAIYIGEDKYGNGIIFEIVSPDNPPEFGYLQTRNDGKGNVIHSAWAGDFLVGVKRYM